MNNKKYLFAERVLLAAVLFFCSGAVLGVLQHPNHDFKDAQQSDSLNLAVEIVLYVAAVPLLLRTRHHLWQALKANRAVCALLVLIIVSVSWSGVPLFSLRRTVAFLMTTAFGLYIAIKRDTEQQVRLLANLFAFCAWLSLFFILFLPEYAIGVESGNRGTWNGVFIQKNVFGRYMVFAIITFLCLPARSKRERLFKYSNLILAVGLLAGTRSAGSYVMFAVSLLLLVVLRLLLHLPWQKLLLAGTAVGIALTAGALYIYFHLDALFRVLGKNATLTGRIDLWHVLLIKFADRPWLGYGFAGFWSTQAASVWSMVPGLQVLKAHNGYLDACLELGLVGITLYAVTAIIAARRCVRIAAGSSALYTKWPLMILSMILLYNIFESELLYQNNIAWVIYVAVMVSTQRVFRTVAAISPPSPESEQLMLRESVVQL